MDRCSLGSFGIEGIELLYAVTGTTRNDICEDEAGTDTLRSQASVQIYFSRRCFWMPGSCARPGAHFRALSLGSNLATFPFSSHQHHRHFSSFHPATRQGQIVDQRSSANCPQRVSLNGSLKGTLDDLLRIRLCHYYGTRGQIYG